MPYADPVVAKAYHKKKAAEWYQKNKTLTKARSKARRDVVRKALKSYINEIKASVTCIHCSEGIPISLDFHHTNPRTKVAGVADMVHSQDRTKIDAEMIKCVVICKNHHAQLHAGIIKVSKRRLATQLTALKRKIKELSK